MKKSFYLDDSRHSIDWAPQSIDWDHSHQACEDVSAEAQAVTRALGNMLAQAAPQVKKNAGRRAE